MTNHFKTIGLIGKRDGPEVVDTLRVLLRHLRERDVRVLVDQMLKTALHGVNSDFASRSQLGEECDLSVVVGGDGTLLDAARTLVDYGVPLVGVNFGRLGFLTDISPRDILQKFDEILAGRYIEEERCLLSMHILGMPSHDQPVDALNDVVLHKWDFARMIEFETYIDGNFVYSQRSDGLVISTPTGSTAYALSAGGPLLQPELDAIVLAPICPHTISNRPLVVKGDSRVQLVLSTGSHAHARVTCDGQITLELAPGECIWVHKKDRKLRLIHPMDHDHFEILRAKLHWGKKL
jgi:NAD+ kinase